MFLKKTAFYICHHIFWVDHESVIINAPMEKSASFLHVFVDVLHFVCRQIHLNI